MRLTLPLPPNMLNARGHWRVRWRAKNRFYGDCDERQMVGLIPAPPAFPLERAELVAEFFLHNRMDEDNIAARLKHVLDWLVTRGYLVDDSPDHLKLLGIAQHIDRKNKRLELTLESA